MAEPGTAVAARAKRVRTVALGTLDERGRTGPGGYRRRVWWWSVALLVGLAGGVLIGRGLRFPPAPANREDPRDVVAPKAEVVVAQPVRVTPSPAPAATDPGDLDPAMADVLAELPGIVLVVDSADYVVHASDAAVELRLARRGRLMHEGMSELAHDAVLHGVPQVKEMSLRRPPMRRISVDLRVQAIPLPHEHALLLLTDLTEEHRLGAVRRDFIANVSHELKTPVGAMSLLAEALAAASDDPDAVQHFASRMQTEAKRLTTLINDVIDLSRVQGDDPLSHAEIVSVDDLVASAIDFVKGAAEAKDIRFVVGGDRGDKIFGDPGQLETAVRNVLANAIAYSEPGTRVAVAVRSSATLVEIDVKDQGMGVPDAEIDRIFERFYRVDAARSRVTGGTGLGLSIVRNVCRNHGGDCLVWSVENEGTTFTLQFPRYVTHADADADADDQEEVTP